MDPRLNQFFDGELPLDALSPAERERAAELNRLFDRAATRLRPDHVPDLTDRVMAALAPMSAEAPAALPPVPAAPWYRRVAGWLWSPRPVRLQLRPAYALALAALAAVVLALPSPSAPGGGAADPQASALFVQFRLDAPDASQVMLAGSFTDWEPRYEMHEVAPGVWSVLVPLRPGVHDYTFVVDGARWIPDPLAPQVPDHFGGANSRLTLLPPQSGT